MLLRTIALTLFALVFHFSSLHAQCGITVDAGPDLLVCGQEVPIILEGSISDNALGFEWVAHPTLVEGESENPEAYPSETTTYTMVGYFAEPEDNLVFNGDFEMGDVGFISDYNYGDTTATNPLGQGSTYLIGDETQPTHVTLFEQCFDHTLMGAPGGMAMYCNGSVSPNERVWCQTVPIVENQSYVLRAWITAIRDLGAAELQFSVNGDVVGPIFFPDIDNVCKWDLFDERWQSTAGETTAEICIVNQTTIFDGYNFGIDDLYFAPVCEQFDEVTVTVVPNQTDLEDQYVLPCNPPSGGYAINPGDTPTGPGYSYVWTTTDGNIVSGANALNVRIDQTGTYTLEMTYTQGPNTCVTSQSTLVVPSPVTPLPLLTSAGDLSCNRSTTMVSAEESTTPPGTLFFWAASNGGSIIGPSNTEEITVGSAGTYLVTMITPQGCSEEAMISVAEDFTAPTAAVAQAEDLTCEVTQIELDGSSSLLLPADEIEWTTTNGNLVSGANTLNPVVDQPGLYTLTVRNPNTGCVNSAFVTVGGSTAPTVAAVADPGNISCQGDPISLDGAGSTATAGTVYAWTTVEGAFAGPTNQLSTSVSAPGAYQLLVTEANGCRDSVTVTVVQDGFNPTVTFAPPGLVTCDVPEIELNADVPTTENVGYQWSSPDGNITAGATTLNPTVNAAGTYMLTVTQLADGCQVSGFVEVTADNEAPTAVATASSNLDCLNAEAELRSTGSSSGPDLDLIWTDGSGNPVDTTIQDAGFYRLTVNNTTNGCSATDGVTVAIDTLAPVADVSATVTELTCVEASTLLGGPTAEANVDYLWSGPPTVGVADLAQPQITGTLPGVYTLTSTNLVNGCTTSNSVEITADQDLPTVDIVEPSQLLTCDITELQLEGSIADAGDFAITWTSTGNFVSGEDGVTPIVDAPGSYTLEVVNTASNCRQTATVTVGQDIDRPTAAIAAADPLTCQEPATTLDASASSDGAEFTFAWATTDGRIVDPLTQRDVRIDRAGTYTLRVTDVTNGCFDETNLIVTEDGDRPIIDMDTEAVLTCLVTSATLNEGAVAEAGLVYNWTTLDGELPATTNMPQINIQTPGTYELLVSNPGNGCSTNESVVVTLDDVAPLVTISEPGALNCANTVVAISSAGSTVDRPATYSWSSANGSFTGSVTAPQTEVDAPGNYALTVRYDGNGCESSVDVTVAIDTLRPVFSIEPVAALDCTTEEVTATVSTTTARALNFDWQRNGIALSPAADGRSLSLVAPGVVTVEAVDPINFCSAAQTFTVAIDTLRPRLRRSPVGVITCANAEVAVGAALTGGRPGPDLVWTNPDGSTDETIDATARIVNVPGFYRLVAMDPINGCTDEATWTVAEDRARPVISLPAEVDLGCEDAPFTVAGALGAGGNYDITWTTTDGEILSGGTSLEAVIAGPSVYTLTVRDQNNGCVAEASLVATQTLLDSFDVLTLSPDCQRPAGLIAFGAVSGGVGPFMYSLDGGQRFGLETQFPNLVPGNYDLRVQDVRGCEASASVTITEARDFQLRLPERVTINLADSTVLNLETTYGAEELDTIIWAPAVALSCTDCLNPVAKPLETTEYQVVVRTRDGCEALTRVQVVVDQRIGVYFPTGFSPNDDGVNDVFAPLADADRVVAIRTMAVYDRWGNQVYTAEDLPVDGTAGGWDGRARDRMLNTGTYIYSAEVEFFGGVRRTFGGEVVLMR